MFEYGAILKGSQTEDVFEREYLWFEYGAILKGSQTTPLRVSVRT